MYVCTRVTQGSKKRKREQNLNVCGVAKLTQYHKGCLVWKISVVKLRERAVARLVEVAEVADILRSSSTSSSEAGRS